MCRFGSWTWRMMISACGTAIWAVWGRKGWFLGTSLGLPIAHRGAPSGASVHASEGAVRARNTDLQALSLASDAIPGRPNTFPAVVPSVCIVHNAHERLHATLSNVNAPTSSTTRVVCHRQNARYPNFGKRVHEIVEIARSSEWRSGALERLISSRVCGARLSQRAARRCESGGGRSAPSET